MVNAAPSSYTLIAAPVGGGTTRAVASLPGGGFMAFDATSLYVLDPPYLWRVLKQANHPRQRGSLHFRSPQ